MLSFCIYFKPHSAHRLEFIIYPLIILCRVECFNCAFVYASISNHILPTDEFYFLLAGSLSESSWLIQLLTTVKAKPIWTGLYKCDSFFRSVCNRIYSNAWTLIFLKKNEKMKTAVSTSNVTLPVNRQASYKISYTDLGGRSSCTHYLSTLSTP